LPPIWAKNTIVRAMRTTSDQAAMILRPNRKKARNADTA
jgi:hypothetical protein